MRSLALLAILALAVVPAAQGATFALDTTFAYLHPSNNAVDLTVVAGKMDVTSAAGRNAFAFDNVTGFVIDGAQQVYASSTNHVYDHPKSGAFRITVSPRSLVVLDPGASASATASSGYALAVPVDPNQDVGGLQLRQSLVAASIGTTVTFAPIQVPSVDVTRLTGTSIKDVPGAKLVLLDPSSGLTVTDGTTTVTTVAGGSAQDPHGVALSGTLTLQPFTAATTLLPVGASPAAATFAPASSASLNQARRDLGVNQLMASLQRIQGNPPSTKDTGLGAVEPVLLGMLDAGMLHVNATGGKPDFGNLTIARGGSLDLGFSSSSTHITGRNALIVRGGHVVGSHPLVPLLPFLAIPWWTIALWVIGITLWVLCLVLKKSKHHEHWDRYKWIGRIATLLAFLLIAWLWDLKVHAVLGISALDGSLPGTTRLVLAGVEYILLAGILALVFSPTRLILRSAFRLSGQGTFMGMASPAALLLTWLVGFGLLLDYLGFLLGRVAALAK